MKPTSQCLERESTGLAPQFQARRVCYLVDSFLTEILVVRSKKATEFWHCSEEEQKKRRHICVRVGAAPLLPSLSISLSPLLSPPERLSRARCSSSSSTSAEAADGADSSRGDKTAGSGTQSQPLAELDNWSRRKPSLSANSSSLW